MTAKTFTIIRQSRCVIACYDEKKTRITLNKTWHALAFLDNNTQGGMSKNKLIKNTDMEKTSGAFIMQQGTKVPTGWQSTIIGIIADDPQKIRGDRTERLILDEAGSFPKLEKAFIQGEALVNVGGEKFGVILAGGTGGDSGPALEGLRKLYYDPETYGALPYQHNFTQTGETVRTGFFIPAYQQVYELMDERGYCDPAITKPLLQKERDKKLGNPSAYLTFCAEYCWTAEEAFAMEGENKFNKALIAELLANIRLHKLGPKPECGKLSYIFKNNNCNIDEISGFNWTPDKNSKLKILEHPIWSDIYIEQLKRALEKALSEGREADEVVQYQQMNDLYIAGVDGIDIGKSQTSTLTKDPSDFCIVVMKRAMGNHPPLIVALYKDRPQEVNTAYKIALCLIKYYNAKVNVEATRVGFLNWAKTAGLLRYFMKRPKATLTDIKHGSTKQYGTPATGVIIEMQTDLISTYIEDYYNLIWFEEILDELERYNDENKRKFDIVASLGMLMLADLELSARVPTKVELDDSKFSDYGYWKDEKGYIHYGEIPLKNTKEALFAEFPEEYEAYDPYRVESSDPRLNSRTSQQRIYRQAYYRGY